MNVLVRRTWLAVATALVVGCAESQPDIKFLGTVNTLRDLDAIVRAMASKGVDVGAFQSVDELLRQAETKLDMKEIRGSRVRMGRDAWQKPLTWSVSRTDDEVVIIIGSLGRLKATASTDSSPCLRIVIGRGGEIASEILSTWKQASG